MKFNLALLTLLRSKAKSIPGGNSVDIYNSSITPKQLPFNTYNYCNAPHVNAAHYQPPDNVDAVLKHVTIVMRHHKVRWGLNISLLQNASAFNLSTCMSKILTNVV